MTISFVENKAFQKIKKKNDSQKVCKVAFGDLLLTQKKSSNATVSRICGLIVHPHF